MSGHSVLRALAGGTAGLLLLGAPSSASDEPAHKPDSFRLQATWKPMRDSKYRLFESTESLRAMQSPRVASAAAEWPNQSIEFALPPADQPLDQPFRVPVDGFMPFLRQLHPGAAPRVTHMIPAPGAYGVVLQRDATTLDLFYRVHAGFELVQDKAWIAVAQFEGRLILEPTAHAVRHFSLTLPPTTPNIDMNVRAEGIGITADIGSVPEMTLSTERSAPDVPPDRLESVRKVLRRSFYDFAAIEWTSLQEGLERAIAEDMPLHVVILFGALTDESC